MDVSKITNIINIPHNNSDSNNIKVSLANKEEQLFNNKDNSFDYDKVMMNLEEVQDFLFMLIGSESPTKAAKASKGKFFNLFA